jgi:hypothetical protein
MLKVILVMSEGLAQEIFGVQQGEGFLDDGAGEFKTGLRAMLMRRTAYN